MAEESRTKLAAILWFVAALLALAAAAVNYSRNGGIKWFLLAAAFFLIALGVNARRRSKAGGA